ncbi:MAG: GDSL-type esterase/lipase family protein, partial [Armatimonadota bacterium]
MPRIGLGKGDDKMWKSAVLAGLLVCTVPICDVSAEARQFPFRGGDTIVMLGDSITRQHLHTNYIELYCLSRFPQYRLRFRNSGVDGDTVSRAMARLEWDVLAWKPSVTTIELGMNDAGSGPEHVPAYAEQLKNLVVRIRRAGVRPVLLTASPVNDGSTSDKMAEWNATLDKMAAEVVKLAKREDLPYADQFLALLD